MQMQKAAYTISPAVRGHYTKQAPHALTLRLSWTRRRVSAPAPAEEREAARVLQEADASLEDVRKVATPPHELCTQESYAILAAPFKKDVTITNQSLAECMVSLRDLGSTIPGGPVSSVHWSALLRTERAKPAHGLLGAEQPCVNNTGSSRSYHCLKTIQEHRIGAGSQRHHQG